MTKISDASLVAAATDNMQMPTGEPGDLAVSVGQIKTNVIADTNSLYDATGAAAAAQAAAIAAASSDATTKANAALSAANSYTDSGLSGKEDTLGYTPENAANKDAAGGYASVNAIQRSSLVFAVASGTNTYIATLTPPLASYVAGQVSVIQFTNASTSTAPTLNINSLGARTIVKRNNTALVTGDIAAGQIYSLVYDGTNFRLMGIANTGILNDLLIGNQSAASTKKNGLLIDDTGKVTKVSWVEHDTTNQKITSTGVDDLEATVQAEWKNNSGTAIMQILNGLKVIFGGTSSFLEVQSGISDGNAGVIFLESFDIAYRLKDHGSFDYIKLKSSTSGIGRAVTISQKQVNNYSQGFEYIRDQFKLTLPNTTAGLANIVGSIAVPIGYALELKVLRGFAVATNNSINGWEPFGAVGRNVAGTTTGTSTTATAIRVTATTGGISVVWNDTTDTADITFTNETGTGRQYDVIVDFDYALYPIPV